MTSLTVRMLGHMLVGEVSLKNMSGPIAIATVAAMPPRLDSERSSTCWRC